MPGLASLLRGRTTNPRAAAVAAARRKEMLRRRGTPPPMWDEQGNPWPSGQSPGTRIGGPPGGKTGGVVGYQRGGRTTNPRAAATAAMLRNRPHRSLRRNVNDVKIRYPSTPPGGWQEGGPVGVSPEEVDMASDIYARAAPEQQAQITGGGGGPGMMDEEAAIGEALAMAMGGGGGPPMNGGPPMGGMI